MRKQNTVQNSRVRRGAFRRKLIQSAIVAVIIISSVMILAHSLIKYLRASDYFRIDEVIFNEAGQVDLAHLKGQNIFAVDSASEIAYILQNYPLYRSVSFVRILPNRVFVTCVKRQPLALVKLYKYFAVDKEGILFDTVELSFNQLTLPVITGIETQITSPKLGKHYNVKELIVSLNLLRRINLNRSLRSYRISKIQADKLSNISIFILVPLRTAHYIPMRNVPNQLSTPVSYGLREMEVRIDAYNIRDKLNILANLLNQEKEDLSNIKYIDLRFKEPVIKFNET